MDKFLLTLKVEVAVLLKRGAWEDYYTPLVTFFFSNLLDAVSVICGQTRNVVSPICELLCHEKESLDSYSSTIRFSKFLKEDLDVLLMTIGSKCFDLNYSSFSLYVNWQMIKIVKYWKILYLFKTI